MKKNIQFLSILIGLLGAAQSSVAQSAITCNDFCVTGFQLDTLTHTLTATIHMGGTSSDFISYPYVRAITDVHGDTIATGTVNLFGMGGNTTSDYDTQTMLDSLPLNFTCTIHFQYFDSGFGAQNCSLPYPCTSTTKIEEKAGSPVWSLYPNPTSGHLFIQSPNILSHEAKWSVRNVYGQKVMSGQSVEEKLDISSLPKGVYTFDVIMNGKTTSQKIILY